MSEKETDQNLQFDKAEFDQASTAATCSMCNTPLKGSYFSVNMQSMCANCTETVRTTIARKSGTGDVLKSILFGIGAGIAGSLIYYAVLKFTGYEIGLIAILVGYMVGRAVMIGSGHRGGLQYRIIAVLITYISIVSTYVPMVISEFKKQAAVAETTQNATIEKAKAAQPAAPAAPQPPISFGEALVALLLFAGAMLILPFLAGISNIIGLLIIGFALFEAWRRTAKPKVDIEGPFEIIHA